ncbi:MAG: universal stress protein [Brachybacterium sp.]|nr:universal stress protein [Brachybacterium sp.]
METTSPTPGPRVVVGVADTGESDRAVRWGADHAARAGGSLHLVHAFVWPLMGVDVDPVPGISGSGLRVAAERLLETAADRARELAPDLPVTTEVRDGRAVDVLLELSAEADIISVGNRGLGRVLAMVLGSSSLVLARRSRCPVVVVRGEELTDGPVGLMYEGSDHGVRAMHRAGALADLYGTAVHVVIGIQTPPREYLRILRTVTAVVHHDHPGVAVRLADIPAAADARHLIEASTGSRIVVVTPRRPDAPSAAKQTASVLQLADTPVWIERSGEDPEVA